MSSEQVSNGRLEALRGLNAMRAEMVSHTDHDRKAFSDVASALTELKSRRAQQAEPPAGCAEMATTIEKAIADADESGFDEWRCGIIHDKLAPLFTLLAECRDRYVALRASIEEPPRTESVVETVQRQAAEIDKFDATLAKLDAALGKGDADGGREEVESE